jgi:hypothetical protein
MLVVRGPALAVPVDDPNVRRLIERRLFEICNGGIYDPELHGEVIVAEPGDDAGVIEKTIDFPLLTNPFDHYRYGHPDFVPICEVIEDHGCCYEMVVVLNDDGTGLILFVPKQPGIDPELLSMCAAFSVPAVRTLR